MSEDEPSYARRKHRPDTPENGELDFGTFMNTFTDDVKGYVEAQKRVLFMQATDKASTLMAKTVQHVVLFVMLGITLLFLNIALALYLGDLLTSRPLGFVLVSGFYLLLLAVFFLWWNGGAKDRFILGRINDLSNDD